MKYMGLRHGTTNVYSSIRQRFQGYTVQCERTSISCAPRYPK